MQDRTSQFFSFCFLHFCSCCSVSRDLADPISHKQRLFVPGTRMLLTVQTLPAAKVTDNLERCAFSVSTSNAFQWALTLTYLLLYFKMLPTKQQVAPHKPWRLLSALSSDCHCTHVLATPRYISSVLYVGYSCLQESYQSMLYSRPKHSYSAQCSTCVKTQSLSTSSLLILCITQNIFCSKNTDAI